MRKFSKKTYLATGAAAIIVAAGAGSAIAYWTTSGTGTGSASTGTSSSFVVTTDPAAGDPLTPGGPSETVAVHVNNPSSGHQKLQTLTVAVAQADGSAWTTVSGCSAADYTVSVPVTATDLAPGATYDTVATISMNNLASSQDGCKGATVPLYFAAG